MPNEFSSDHIKSRESLNTFSVLHSTRSALTDFKRDLQSAAAESLTAQTETFLPTKCTLPVLIGTLRKSAIEVIQGSNSFGTYLDLKIPGRNIPVRVFYISTDGNLIGITSYDEPGMEQFYREFIQKNKDLFFDLSSYEGKLEKDIKITKRINSLPHYTSSVDGSFSGKAHFIGQREGMLSSERIETAGVANCVALILLNKDTGEQFMCHVDSGTILDTESIPNKIRTWQNTEAVIGGGIPEMSEPTIGTIFDLLDALKVTNVSQYQLLVENPNSGASFSSIPVKDRTGLYSLDIMPNLRTNLSTTRIIEPPMNRTPLKIKQ